MWRCQQSKSAAIDSSGLAAEPQHSRAQRRTKGNSMNLEGQALHACGMKCAMLSRTEQKPFRT